MAGQERLTPASEGEVIEAIRSASADGRRLEIRGGGSKAQVGAPVRDAVLLDMSAFASVIDYDPAELVLTAGAGTPLAHIEALVASENQMLAFEPFDHGPLFGQATGASTIGGVIAAGVAGSRRISGGAARDHLLGFKGVSGRGEAFTAGAKVVKNVTGYDLPKLAAGSWGRLAAFTEVTLKVLPRGRERSTLMVEGLGPAEAQALMARAMASQAEVSAAGHLPAAQGGPSLTAMRLEGFGPSVAARRDILASLCPTPPTLASDAEAEGFWQGLRSLAPLADGRPLWRVNVPPSGGAQVVAALEPQGARWLFDWAGGLVWLTFDGEPGAIRAAAQAAGGHATLVRGPDELRARTPAFHPQSPGVMALERRVRAAFDPLGVFETGRFLDAEPVHAD